MGEGLWPDWIAHVKVYWPHRTTASWQCPMGFQWLFSGERIVDAENLQPHYGTDHNRVPPTYQSESIRNSLSRHFSYFAIVPQILTGSTDSSLRSLNSSWTLLEFPNVFPSYQQAYRGDAVLEDV